jgi:Secretion system C-terminal sorting domain
MRKYFLLFVLIICLQNLLKAQIKDLQTPCTTTSQGTVGNFIISYTIGEMVLVDSWKKDGLTLTQGVLQPIVPAFDNGNNNFNTGEITVYPNPTPKDLFIRYNILQLGKLSVQLYDVLGQRLLIDEISITSFGTKKFDFSKYASAAYMLMVQFTSADGATIKKGKYKIVKAQ